MTPEDLHAAAQAEADRFYGDGPVAPWQPEGDEAPPSRWPVVLAALVVALLIGSTFAAAGFFAGAAGVADEVQDRKATARPDIASHFGDPDDDLIDDPATPAPVGPVVRPAGGAQLTVMRRGREWHIEAAGASRLLVAQRLAEATGSTLRGDVSLLAGARPLDLHWQGRGAAQAWQAVLGRELSFLTQCSASRCRVWLLQPGDDNPLALAPPRPTIPLPAAEPVAVAATPQVPQSDSADPRVAAHHD